MFDINVKVIPHSEQRYETVGDWWFTGLMIAGKFIAHDLTSLEIRVSAMANPDYEFLVAFHEQAEAMLCLKRGIKEEDVSTFDKLYEKSRPEGDISEPGDNYLAPYRKEHFFATTVERLMAAELNIDWSEYDKAIQNL